MLPCRLALPTLLAALVGCPGSADPPPTELSFELDWTADGGEPLAFGAVRCLEAAVLPTTVTNVGSASVAVTGIAARGSGFRLLEQTPLWLSPGDSAELSVEYRPSGNEVVAGFLELETRPPLLLPPVLAVRGQGLAAELAWTVLEDLPEGGEPGCPQVARLRLESTGPLPVTVSALGFEGDNDFSLGDAPELPFTLDPGASAEVSMVFDRSAPGTDIDRIVPQTDPAYAATAGPFLQGFAAFVRAATDTFDLGAAPRVDVLLVLDTSPSVGDDQAALAAAVAGLHGGLEAAGVDWRVGAISTDITDGGALHRLDPPPANPWVDDGEPEALARLLALADLGAGGTEFGGGLANAQAALQADRLAPGGDNEGFLRPWTPLVLVFVQDGDDQSGLLDGGGPAARAAAIEAAVGDAGLTRIVAVSGGPDGCSEGDRSAAPAPALAEAVAWAGGEELSFCDPSWGTALGGLDWATPDVRGILPLGETPWPEGIEVSIDAIPIGGWTYAPDPPRVLLGAGPLPEAGAVTVTYPVVEGC